MPKTIKTRCESDGMVYTMVFQGSLRKLCVRQLKHHLADLTRIDPALQRLFYNEAELHDAATCTEAGIRDNAILVLREWGSAEAPAGGGGGGGRRSPSFGTSRRSLSRACEDEDGYSEALYESVAAPATPPRGEAASAASGGGGGGDVRRVSGAEEEDERRRLEACERAIDGEIERAKRAGGGAQQQAPLPPPPPPPPQMQAHLQAPSNRGVSASGAGSQIDYDDGYDYESVGSLPRADGLPPVPVTAAAGTTDANPSYTAQQQQQQPHLDHAAPAPPPLSRVYDDESAGTDRRAQHPQRQPPNAPLSPPPPPLQQQQQQLHPQQYWEDPSHEHPHPQPPPPAPAEYAMVQPPSSSTYAAAAAASAGAHQQQHPPPPPPLPLPQAGHEASELHVYRGPPPPAGPPSFHAPPPPPPPQFEHAYDGAAAASLLHNPPPHHPAAPLQPTYAAAAATYVVDEFDYSDDEPEIHAVEPVADSSRGAGTAAAAAGGDDDDEPVFVGVTTLEPMRSTPGREAGGAAAGTEYGSREYSTVGRAAGGAEYSLRDYSGFGPGTPRSEGRSSKSVYELRLRKDATDLHWQAETLRFSTSREMNDMAFRRAEAELRLKEKVLTHTCEEVSKELMYLQEKGIVVAEAKLNASRTRQGGR